MAKLGQTKQGKPAIKEAGKAGAKKPVTYRFPGAVKDAMLAAVVEERYGLKGKSRWIAEAIEGFVQDPSWMDQVLDGDMTMGNDTKDVVYLDPDTKRLVESGTRLVMAHAADMKQKKIRQENIDTLNVTASSVIRAAIVWRLFGLRMPVIAAAAG